MSLSRSTFLHERLTARAEQLRREIQAALHDREARDAPALPNRADEVDDAAVADLESELDIASVERDTRELEEVTAALERLGSPGFGRCVACGKPIAWQRLEAQPQAQRCLPCEQRAEKNAPRRHPSL